MKCGIAAEFCDTRAGDGVRLWPCQAPLSMEIPKNTGVGCMFPPSGDLSDPGMEPGSPALAGRYYTTEPPGEASQVD